MCGHVSLCIFVLRIVLVPIRDLAIQSFVPIKVDITRVMSLRTTNNVNVMCPLAM